MLILNGFMQAFVARTDSTARLGASRMHKKKLPHFVSNEAGYDKNLYAWHNNSGMHAHLNVRLLSVLQSLSSQCLQGNEPQPFHWPLPAQITLTTREGAEFSKSTLPVNYGKFPSMVLKGDTVFIGRYLVTGAEASSLYLTVC